MCPAARFRRLAILVATLLPGSVSVVASAPPSLTETRFLPGDDTPAAAIGMQSNPQICAGDESYLAVWVDSRASITHIGTFSGGPTYDEHTGSMWDIYAVRLNANGDPIDSTPIIVAQQVMNQGIPDVAWNGENWLVIWTGQVGLQCCANEDRYAARVSPDGVVLDETPIAIARYPEAEALWPAAVGSDGTNWLVVWMTRGTSTSFRVNATRVAPDGTVLDPGGVEIAAGSSPGDFDVAFAGGEYFVTWSSGGMTSGGDILGQRLQPDLTRIGGPIRVNLYTPSLGWNGRVATDGTDYFVTWWEHRYDYYSALVGARVTHDGTVLDPDGLFLTEAYGTQNYFPSVTFDGVNYVVVYDRSDRDLYATRVTPAGVILDYDIDAIPVSSAPEPQWMSAVDRLPGMDRSLAIWRDDRHSPSVFASIGDIFAATIEADGSVGSEHCVALGAPRQTLLRLIPNDTGHLAVYRSETSSETRILAQRLDAGGTAIDAEPVVVVAGGAGISSPAAAWNGSVHLVVWEDGAINQAFGRRFTADLTPLDVLPISIMPGNMTDVAALDDLFLVVTSWEEPHEVRGGYGVRVRGSDGAVLDATPRLFSSGYTVHPRVATLGDRWITVWESHATHDTPSSTAKGNFVDQTGAPGAWFYVDLDARKPVVAGSGDQALLVVDGRNWPLNQDVYARRILSDGTLLDDYREIVVAEVAEEQFDTAVAWDGSEFVTTFSDFRDDTFRSDLYGARVGGDGAVLDPGGFVVVNDSIPEMFSAVTGSGGEFVIGGSIFRPDDGYANYRIAVRSSSPVVGTPGVGDDIRPPLLTLTRNPTPGPMSIVLTPSNSAPVTVSVFDAAGRLVYTLFEGRAHGVLRLTWDGRDARGREVAPGTYFVRAATPASESVVRAVRL